MKRGDIEQDLTFAGFVIISCPLKSTSKNAIKEIQHASHHVSLLGEGRGGSVRGERGRGLVKGEESVLGTN